MRWLLIFEFLTALNWPILSFSEVLPPDQKRLKERITQVEQIVGDPRQDRNGRLSAMDGLEQLVTRLSEKYFGRIDADSDMAWYVSLNFYVESLRLIPWSDFNGTRCKDYEHHVLTQFDPARGDFESVRSEVRWTINRLREICK